MLLVSFNPKLHSAILLEWTVDRGINSTLVEDLPEYGVMAFEHDLPIAAGFLRKVEGGYAMLDSLITNPNAPPDIRNVILDRVTTKLIDTARRNKLKALIANSLDKNTLMRSAKHGFTSLPHTLIVLNLSTLSGESLNERN